MAEHAWPPPERRALLGKDVSRIDGPLKVTGSAKYTFDVARKGMLHAKIVRCPHAHARIAKVDVAAASKMPGVKAVRVIQGEGAEIQWALDEIVMVVATSEALAGDAARAVRVEYEALPHFVNEERIEKAPKVDAGDEKTEGDPDGAMASAEVRVEGVYGLPSVAHCCLEPHCAVVQWEDDEHLTCWCSTQGVVAVAQQLGEELGIPAANVRVLAPHVGGGFGSKFGPDRWGLEAARAARELKAPVKVELERAPELAIAGDRPSAYARVQVGAKSDGTLTSWISSSWGSGGLGGSGSPPLPYVIGIPNTKHRHSSVITNTASSRAWRAPNHPQACLITMSAIEDLAAQLRMDPLELLRKNVALLGPRAKTYEDELAVAADLMQWKQKWHQRGASGPGPVKRGLGLSLHAWGGRGHRSNCDVTVYPDGLVEAKIASQDIGTGTRTVIAIVLAETFGLPLSGVRVTLGDSRLPPSGGSGGSTTVGGVSAATRRGADDALAQLLVKAAPKLGAKPEELEAWGGVIRMKSEPSRSMPFKAAAALLGGTPLSVIGANPGEGQLIDGGVGGVQMIEASVDVETGVVRVEKVVAVQDCGLVVDRKTAESQVLGGVIMGISTALCEEKVHDPVTGRLLNADMENYKLPGIADVGEIVVHFMTTKEHDSRGVIGLGEPPVISPAAALSNAVANAVGVRVPTLPLTPDRVLAALAGKGRS